MSDPDVAISQICLDLAGSASGERNYGWLKKSPFPSMILQAILGGSSHLVSGL